MSKYSDYVPELIEILLSGIGTAALSAIGMYIELLAIETFQAGETVVALWLVAAGGALLYFGIYLLGVGQFLPRLLGVVASASR